MRWFRRYRTESIRLNFIYDSATDYHLIVFAIDTETGADQFFGPIRLVAEWLKNSGYSAVIGISTHNRSPIWYRRVPKNAFARVLKGQKTLARV